jgi:cytochrome c oxidase subunit 2
MKNFGLHKIGIGLGIWLGLTFCVSNAFGQDADHGQDGFKLCASCHGFRGEGNALVNAPALAGQESWYLERQIRNFRDKIRGGDAKDANGHRMAQMAMGLSDDDDIADLVAYIETLPAAKSALVLTGNAETGRQAYSTCAACHGQNASGNSALNAPGLARLDDWYQLGQLKKFKAGLRGTDARDTYGQQMQPMATMLVDEQAMQDVIAYIVTLR